MVFNNGNNKISYIYNATGQKVTKVVNENSVITKTDYLDGYQYKDNYLRFFPHAEGYVNVVDSHGVNNYNYIFNYTDHLGNIRVSYGVDPDTQTLKILEENHYYPFGLKHEGYNMDYKTYQQILEDAIKIKMASPVDAVYNYKYNGKELQTELGLDLYDYGARNYDPAIGRWLNIDPLAEKYLNFTPYNYVSDNPINLIDPDGKDGVRVVDTKNKTITIKAVYFLRTKDKETRKGTEKGYSAKRIAKIEKRTNEWLNKQKLVADEGEYEGYSVKFDLSFKEGGHDYESRIKADSETLEGVNIGNSMDKMSPKDVNIFEKLVSSDGETSTQTGGVTENDKNITMNTDATTKLNEIHEIGHTLGLDHPKGKGNESGLMAYPPEKFNQKEVNQLANNSFLPVVILKN
ncbi:RHS repeat domain-containing protein [Flavobacterium sp. HNIBRBA15423]|uniref:RHS repeat domain-containing protein n=1 Tax=Flavobacterium sp. HNIBRBA15423 TaxID=3458683 RepID=UPI0040448BAF